MSSILKASTSGIMVFSAVRDKAGHIIDFRYEIVNEVAAAIAGHGLEGKRLLQEAPGHKDNGLFDQYVRATELQEFSESEFLYQGDRVYGGRWFRNRVSPLQNGFVVSFDEITELKQLIEKYKYQATFDPLTGAWNRTALESSDRCDVVLLLDLDRFKQINDTAGHAVGDQVLVAVSKRVQNLLRPGDIFVRMGGDEFAVLLYCEGNALQCGRSLSERIIKALASPIAVSNGGEYQIGCSIGVYELGSDDSLDHALSCADIAMYSAKNARRDKPRISPIAVFSEAMATKIRNAEQEDQELKEAILNRELIVYYQPIVNLQGYGRSCRYSINGFPLVGFEALVRWNHPDRGIVSPIEFIPVAERAGLTHLLTEYVFSEAYHQLEKWTSPEQPLKMSVNFSTSDLGHPGVLAVVSRIVADGRVTGADISIEMTETEKLDAGLIEIQRGGLHYLKMGLKLSLDDFGTGQNTLIYLTLGIFEILKIDREFVSGSEAHKDKALTLCNLIGAIAHHKNMSVVAEGIETIGQARTLKEHLIDYGQGYYFSKPLSAQDVEDCILR